ncbi:MAG: opioid growth factor receptor-related protein [Burkholderiaceae bacterium]|jgi:hypothetical protein
MNLRAFLENAAPDYLGRMLSDIWQLTDDEMETCHDYIQCVFPLDQESGAVPNAPVLTKEDMADIKSSPVAISNLKQSAQWFYQFLCRNDQWLAPANHNHLRITRLIKSLRLLVGDAFADEMRMKILRLAENSGARINTLTLEFWMHS